MGLVACMKLDWLKLIGIAAIVSLIVMAGWACYKYYFCKPIPVVNNYTAPVTQIHNEIKKAQHLYTGVFCGFAGKDKMVGGEVGWLW